MLSSISYPVHFLGKISFCTGSLTVNVTEEMPAEKRPELNLHKAFIWHLEHLVNISRSFSSGFEKGQSSEKSKVLKSKRYVSLMENKIPPTAVFS